MKQLAMNIQDELSKLKNFETPFSSEKLFQTAKRSPRLYQILVLLNTFLGLGFIFILPVTAIYLLDSLFSLVPVANTVQDWVNLLVYLIIMVICGMFSYAIYRLPFSAPKGLEVKTETFPRLMELIDELRSSYHNPRIDRVIIRDKFDIRIVKTPRFGIPFITSNTLIIGLPTLLALSPLNFRIMLARRIGQASAKHNRVSNTIYNLADIWQQYRYSSRLHNDIFSRILAMFFRFYSPYYSLSMGPIRKADEFEADHYAIELVNDKDMVAYLVYMEVVEHFLKKKYWPKLRQLVGRNDKSATQPFSQITKVTRLSINQDEVRTAIQEAMRDKESVSAMPSLPERLDNLGHNKPLPPKALEKSAAEFLLATNLKEITAIFDQRWYKKHARKPAAK